MSKSYDRVSTGFIKAVQQMQRDLQYLADHNNLDDKFFDKQNRIIASLIDYHKSTQAYTQLLETELLEHQLAHSIQSKQHENRIVCFEAICIMHGILDFPLLLRRGKAALLREAVELGKERKMQLPDLLNEKIKRLVPEDRKQLERILFADTNAKITELLKKINLKTAAKYGFRTSEHTPKI